MTPNLISESGTSNNERLKSNDKATKKKEVEMSKPSVGPNKGTEWSYLHLKWRNTIVLIGLHIAMFFCFANWPKRVLSYIVQFLILLGAAFGVTVGAHRYFTHKTFRANSKLKYFLIFLQTLSAQEDIIKWVRDHRVHHKYTDTNADPHNSQRGFFFSHMGWLFVEKHPDVTTFGKRVDMSDLESDPALLIQRKVYMFSSIMLAFILPIFGSWYLFDDDFVAVMNLNILRYVLGLHVNWSINSFAHWIGSKPYERNSSSTDSYTFGFLAFGEGWHNFHHAFPWDYKTGEFGNYWFNFSLIFIDLFAKFGWATDLKTVSDDVIKKRVLRTGDGSHKYSKEAKKHQQDIDNNNITEERDVNHFWGWEDEDMTNEDKEVVILHRQYE